MNTSSSHNTCLLQPIVICLGMSHFNICMSTKITQSHGQTCTENKVVLVSVSLRSRGTIQGGSPGINGTGLRRQPRSQSLCSQRRSSSNSRKSTLAGLTRRIIKMHQSINDRDDSHCGNAKSCFVCHTGFLVRFIL